MSQSLNHFYKQITVSLRYIGGGIVEGKLNVHIQGSPTDFIQVGRMAIDIVGIEGMLRLPSWGTLPDLLRVIFLQEDDFHERRHGIDRRGPPAASNNVASDRARAEYLLAAQKLPVICSLSSEPTP